MGFAEVGDEEAPEEGAEAPEQQDTTLAEHASKWWDANRMDANQDELHNAAVRDGEAYILVTWDGKEGRPRWLWDERSDGTQGLVIHREPETGEVMFASKTWQIYAPMNKILNARTRMTLYFPDRVEKYIAIEVGEMFDPHVGKQIKLTQWAQWFDDGDMDANGVRVWPIPWTVDGKLDGEPLGIAVIPFTNPGGSEITALVPLQDMLNKADMDLVAGTDYSGFRVLWGSGLEKQTDSSGNETSITVGPGQFLRIGNPQGRIGAIDPAPLESMLNACRYWIESGAGVTRTPHYLFQAQGQGAEPPSGESLKMQEVGLIHKVERRQRVFGNAWEDVIKLSVKLWNKWRGGEAIEMSRLQTVWRDPETRNEKDAAETATLKSGLNVPDEALWAELGYDAEQIEEFKAMVRSRPGAVGASMLDFMRGNEDRGAVTPEPGGEA